MWGIAWRIAAAGFLLWFISEESQVLRINFARVAAITVWVPGWDFQYRVRQQLFPVCGLFAMLGLVVGMGAGFWFPTTVRRRGRPYGLFVVLAGVTGLLIVAVPSLSWWPMMIYLIANAFEAVNNAMYHRLTPGPSLSTRLLHAGIDAAVAAVFCLALAIMLARDFEMLRRGRTSAASPAGRVLRALVLMGTAAGGVYIATVTIPAFHSYFIEGFCWIMGPAQAAMIVCSFALFGAGMAARALAGPPQRQSSVWGGRLSACFRLAILGVLLFAVLNVLPDTSVLPVETPAVVRSAIAIVQESLAPFWDRLPASAPAAGTPGSLGLDSVLWLSLMLAIVCFVVELLIRDSSELDSPFDRLVESPQRIRTFLWLVLSFVVLCLAAAPTLIVAGQAIVHLRLHAADLMTHGWAG